MNPYDAVLFISFGGPEKREDVMPFLEMRGDDRYICIATDRGYPVTEELMTDAVRG